MTIPIEDEGNRSQEHFKQHFIVKDVVLELKGKIMEQLRYEYTPHKQALQTLMGNIDQVIGFIANHPLEREYAPAIRRKSLLQTLKRQSISSDSKLVVKIRKVGNTPVHKLRKVMLKKMLLKIITTIYQEVLLEEPREPFYQYINNLLGKKFTALKGVENRFENLLNSCMKYKSLPRVRLFGRFLGLYQPFESSEMAYFRECLRVLMKSSSGGTVNYPEDADHVFVPHVRCLEVLKVSEKYFHDDEIHTIKQKLALISKGNNLVCVDEFLEIMVDCHQTYMAKSLDFLKVLFEASDLNNDGYLQFQEFQILMNHISNQKILPGKVKEIFHSYSENFMTEEKEDVEAISLENLAYMNAQYQVFSEEQVTSFTMASNSLEASEHLEQVDTKTRLNEIYWRMTQSKYWKLYIDELKELVRLLSLKIQKQEKPLVNWVALRLLEEESKSAYVEEVVQNYLPVISRLNIN